MCPITASTSPSECFPLQSAATSTDTSCALVPTTDLETVEASRLRALNIAKETLGEVLEHNAITAHEERGVSAERVSADRCHKPGREECQHVLDEVLLVGSESLPIEGIASKIDLL